MKHCMVAVAVVLAVVCASAAQTTPAKAPTPLEESLIASEKSFITAIKKGDAAFLKRTLADDFSFVSFDGQLYDRQDAIDQMGGGGVDLTPYNLKVISSGDATAIVTYDSILRVPAEEDQGPPPRYQHWTSVWVKQNDVWKLKFQQTTPTHWGDW